MQQNSIQKNIHLLLSSVIVIAAALVYGLSPNTVLPKLFDFQVSTTDLTNVFRAVMGLYLSFASFWIVGILQSKYWKAATISQVLFMLGLAFGRIISVLLDGMPSAIFSFGILGELILGVFGWYQCQKHKD